MGRYDVYHFPAKLGKGLVPDVQTDLLSDLSTRMVVPRLPPELAPKPAQELNPSFDIGGRAYLMLTQFIATIPVKEFKKPLHSLNKNSEEITRALDVLLTGF